MLNLDNENQVVNEVYDDKHQTEKQYYNESKNFALNPKPAPLP